MSVKSSKEVFQQFRKAAIEKERVKALKKKEGVEENKQSEPSENTWYSVNSFLLIHFSQLKLLPRLKISQDNIIESPDFPVLTVCR